MYADLLSVPPGFKSGMVFAPVSGSVGSNAVKLPRGHATIDLANILDADDIIDWQDEHNAPHLPVAPAQVNLRFRLDTHSTLLLTATWSNIWRYCMVYFMWRQWFLFSYEWC